MVTTEFNRWSVKIMCVRNLRPWGLYAACCIGWGLAVVLYNVMPGAKKTKDANCEAL